MEVKSAIEELPENQHFLLAIVNKKPGRFIQYGGYAAVAFVALLLLLMLFVSRKTSVIQYNAILVPAESNKYQLANEKQYRGVFETLPAQAEQINIGDTVNIDVSKYSRKNRFITAKITFKPPNVTASGKKLIEFEFTDHASVFKDMIFDELKVTARLSGTAF